MVFEEDDETSSFLVVVNHEEQYSLWPKDVAVPPGWRVVKDGTRAECKQYVNETWVDMRPLSLRKLMAKGERTGSS